MSEPTFGEIITGETNKDAIHIACAPVIAEMDLKPGWHVGLYERTGRFGVFSQDGSRKDDSDSINRAGFVFATGEHKTIGIVDPFLNEMVKEGQKFWLFLYPKTVTGIRHQWSHPAFPEPTGDAPELAAAKAKVEKIAANNDMSYDKLMEYADLFLATGKISAHMNATGDLGDGGNEDTLEAFWACYDFIRGKRGSGEFLVCCY